MAPQTISPNRPRLKKALAVSTLLHAIVLVAFVLLLRSDTPDKAAGFGNSGFIINVELVGVPHVSHPLLNPLPSLFTSPLSSPSARGGLSYKGEGEEGGEGGSSQILQQIRNKIERAKFYPLIAKRSRVEGSPLIEFKIKNDGSLEYLLLKQSSGSKILDDAALNTVKETQPFPFYPDPIALNVHYTLAP